MKLLCRLGIHSYNSTVPLSNKTDTHYRIEWDEVCILCGKIKRVGFNKIHNEETELVKIRELLEDRLKPQ